MAEIEVLRQNIAQLNVISPVGAEVMAEVRGQRQGESVVASQQNSKISEMSEEIGMSVAHRAEKKELGQRTVRQGQGTNLEAIARLLEYLEKLPNMPREAEIKALIDMLQSFQDRLENTGSGGSRPTKEDILAALQDFDGDVTHQFAALEIARDYFATAGASSSFQALLDEVRGEFDKTDIARDVQAGFAAAEVAARAAETLETDPAKVRDTYRELLRESQNMGQLFDRLSKFDLLKSFEEVVDTFMTAAGRDLGSTGPSTDPAFLHGLLTELGKLKKLQTVFESAGDLVSTAEPLFKPSERGQLDQVGVTSRLLNFTSKAAVNIGDARSLLGSLEKASVSSQLAFTNGVHSLHKEIHDDAMPSVQARQQQSATIEQLLQQLVEMEEQEFNASALPPGPSPQQQTAR